MKSSLAAILICLFLFQSSNAQRGGWAWVATSAGYQMPACNCANCQAVRYQASQNAQCQQAARTIQPAEAASVQRKIYETPPDAIQAFLDFCPLDPNDVLLDLGCGRGKVLIAAAKRYGCWGIGVDNDRDMVNAARVAIESAGLTDRLDVVCADARRHKALYRGATVVYIYQYGHLSRQLIDLVPSDAVIITYQFRVPGRTCHLVKRGGHTFYVVERAW